MYPLPVLPSFMEEGRRYGRHPLSKEQDVGAFLWSAQLRLLSERNWSVAFLFSLAFRTRRQERPVTV